jgi:hypothetical protein
MAGSDAYLGTMTHLSAATLKMKTLIQSSVLTGAEKDAATATNFALPGGFAKTERNSNLADSGTWDIVATDAAKWVIGGAKTPTKITFKIADGKSADW